MATRGRYGTGGMPQATKGVVDDGRAPDSRMKRRPACTWRARARSMIAAAALTALLLVAGDGMAEQVELIDFELGSVLAPGSPLLRPGMHVHDCGDALDVYVTERVLLHGGISAASRRAILRARRTIATFAYGSVGSREQDVVYAQDGAGAEAVGMHVRNHVKAAGVVTGLRPVARILDGESLRVVFVLPLSGSRPTADCTPQESAPRSDSPSVTAESHTTEAE